MKKIGFVVDSTILVPPGLAEMFPLKVVPLKILWDNNEYRECEDLSPEEFYSRMESAESLPRTSAPAPGDFYAAYSGLAAEGCEHIISFHISSKLSSGTVQAASVASKMVKNVSVHIVDSLLTSIAAAVALADMRNRFDQSSDVQELIDFLEDTKKKIDVYFFVESLDYLHRGGRINTIQHSLGVMMKMLPVLGLKDGAIELRDKTFGYNQTEGYVEKLLQKFGSAEKPPRYIVLGYGIDREQARRVEEKIDEYLPGITRLTAQLSPVIGCHTGPHILGMAYL